MSQPMKQQKAAAITQRPMRGMDVGINNYPDIRRSYQHHHEDDDEDDDDSEEEYQGTYFDSVTPEGAKIAVSPLQRQPHEENRRTEPQDELLTANAKLKERAERAESTVRDLKGQIVQLEQQLAAQQRLREEALAEQASKLKEESLEHIQTITRLAKSQEQMMRAEREEALTKMKIEHAAALTTLEQQVASLTVDYEQAQAAHQQQVASLTADYEHALHQEREKVQTAQDRVSELEQQVQELHRVSTAQARLLNRRAATDADYDRLWKASKDGDLASVKAVLDEALVEVNRGDPKQGQCTPLHVAARFGHATVVQLLLDAKANVEAVTKDQNTPLHVAARFGHAPVVQLLLDAKANVEAVTKNQWTPLHLAAFNGHAPVVQLLLGAKANVEAVNENQWTPLHLAAFNGHAPVVQLLLGAKANVEAVNKDGKTPLELCDGAKYPDVAALLLVKRKSSNWIW